MTLPIIIYVMLVLLIGAYLRNVYRMTYGDLKNAKFNSDDWKWTEKEGGAK